MMKRSCFPSTQFFLTALVTTLFALSPLQAQESPAPTEQAVQQEESISTPRKVAGVGVLAFLIGWMFWRNGSANRKNAEQEKDHNQAASQD